MRTKPDQVELLAGFSYVPHFNRHPLGRRVSLGLVLVSTVSSDIQAETYPIEGGSITISGALPSVGAGVAVGFHLSEALSVEANAIPRSFRTRLRQFAEDGKLIFSQSGDSGGTWEFPVLAKLRLASSSWRPFLVLGPSFRLPKLRLPIYGGTVGAGIETKLKGIRVAPATRYTRWGPERPLTPNSADSGVSRNQVQVLVGISF